MVSTFLFLGKLYQVQVSDKKFLKSRVVFEQDKVIIYQSELIKLSAALILGQEIRKKAIPIIKKRVEELASSYGFNYQKIFIKDQSSLWGSCSSKKNLNFNWRLILAVPQILDYVIIHELSHTRVMNHSKDFWKIVSELMPEYREYRRWLRVNGHSLKKFPNS